MFDREKQVVINRFCKAIFHEAEKISVLDLINLNIPDPVKAFISQEIENKVEHEFREFRKFSKFDFDHPKVKPLFDELKVMLKYNRELDIEELSILLKLALDLNLDYLLKPCDTLTNFVFKYDEFQSVEFIKDRLKFVKEYSYFPLLINEFFNRTGISKISKNDFLNLLYKIEKEYTKDFTILDFYNLFVRFKHFLLELNLYINDYPEYEAFIIHLRDKNHVKIAQFLEEHKEHFKSFGGSVVAYLKSLMQPETRVKEPDKKIEEVVEAVETEKSKSISEEESYQVTEKKSDLVSEVNENVDDSSTAVYEESPSTIEKTEEVTSQKTDLYKKLVSTRPEQKIKTYDRNLDGLMPSRLKKKIIKKIFDGNEIVFNEFMSNINKVKNWDEASVLLTDLFDKKNIQPFSKWAIRFTEFLYENIK